MMENPKRLFPVEVGATQMTLLDATISWAHPLVCSSKDKKDCVGRFSRKHESFRITLVISVRNRFKEKGRTLILDQTRS